MNKQKTVCNVKGAKYRAVERHEDNLSGKTEKKENLRFCLTQLEKKQLKKLLSNKINRFHHRSILLGRIVSVTLEH